MVKEIEFKYCNMWLYENNVVNELPEDCVGFVYQITYSFYIISTDKMY